MNRRRLDLESLRDSLLVAAGRLDATPGGPSVPLTTPPFSTRRSVYGFIERQNLPGFFRTFDFASPDAHSPARPHTTVPQQAMYLMNSPFAMEQAAHLAQRAEIREAADGRSANRQPVSLRARSRSGWRRAGADAGLSRRGCTDTASPDRRRAVAAAGPMRCRCC